MKVNENFGNLKESYLFSDIAHRVSKFSSENPDAQVIRLGIGDVTLPLCKAVTVAMEEAVAEMGTAGGFHGYGPEQGYPFLQEAIQKYYAEKGIALSLDEVFISDGAKSDLGNILDIFSSDNCVLIPDPVYPVYVDTNIMAGRRIIFMNANEENAFLPLPEEGMEADIVYLCSPNNPTGAVYTKDQLGAWVDYCLEHDAIILFDAAYESFIQDEDLPKSIYEIQGAEKCAIEFGSFSKMAGFTGTRCGFTVVPSGLRFDGFSLNKLWLRRQTTKFNGVPYIVQRGAAAVFTKEGQKQVKESVRYYMENARLIAQAMEEMGIWYTGGKNSPYIWLKCGMDSWEFFDMLLRETHVVGTPGAGFGKNGDGFFRLTAFGNHENTHEAVRRMHKLKL